MVYIMDLAIISAEELYSHNLELADACSAARALEVTDTHIGGTENIRDWMKVLDMEADTADTVDYAQDVLNLRAEVVQEGILKYKSAYKEIRVAGALARLQIADMAAKEAFQIQGDRWHEDAIRLNEK